MKIDPLVEKITAQIIAGFDRHFRIFNEYTALAAKLFEEADWNGIQLASRNRIQGYDLRIEEAAQALSDIIGDRRELMDEKLWRDIRAHYAFRLKSHLQPKLAESFYNSVFCRLHHRRYYNNDNIFISSSLSSSDIRISSPVTKSYSCDVSHIQDSLKQMMLDFGFGLPFEDLDRDVRFVRRMYARNSRFEVRSQTTFRFDVVKRPFFRSKAAYIIGRIVTVIFVFIFVFV